MVDSFTELRFLIGEEPAVLSKTVCDVLLGVYIYIYVHLCRDKY